MQKVFVYGTLLSGYNNNAYYLGEAEFVGESATKPEFEMYDVCGGGFPGVVDGGETSIVGEIFNVDEETERSLDRLEGVPRMYRRQMITLADGTENVLIYVWNGGVSERYTHVTSGSWRQYKGDSPEKYYAQG